MNQSSDSLLNMTNEVTLEAMFTKDITKKRKKWMDGLATFIKTVIPNKYHIIVRDTEGDQCLDINYKFADGAIPDNFDEERIGGILLSIDSLEKLKQLENGLLTESNGQIDIQSNTTNTLTPNNDQTPSNPFRPPSIRRVGLSRKGIRPQLTITSRTSNRLTEDEDDDQPHFKQPSIPNLEPKRFNPPRSTNEPAHKLSQSNIATEDQSVSPPFQAKTPYCRQLREIPRTFDEIIKFYSVFSNSKAPTAEEIQSNDDQNEITNQKPFDSNLNEKSNSISNPINVLADAMSSEDEHLQQIENLKDNDEEFNSEPKIQTPFQPPTPIANEFPNDSNLNYQIDLLWGSKLKSIGKPPMIPIEFDSIEEYKEYFKKAIVYEINSKIKDVYDLYKAALFSACYKTPSCKSHNAKMNFYINSKNGSYYYQCPHPGCRSSISVPPDSVTVEVEENEEGCSISRQIINKSSIAKFMKKKHIPYFESRITRTKDNTYYLIFNEENDDKIEYSKDDVWVVFSEKLKPFFVCSESYGVYSNSKIEIGHFFNNRLNSIPQLIKVNAIRVFNGQSEKQALMNLLSVDEENVPIFPHLLHGGLSDSFLNNTPDPSETLKKILKQAENSESDNEDIVLSALPEIDVDLIANEISVEYGLNEDQRKALLKTADFFKENNEPFLLVHGLFGAGKSKLLSIILIFLDTVLNQLGRPDKILIAASTNVAVDNVLTNLLDYDFHNFTRVGSVKKIRRSILPFVTGHGNDDSISELQTIIRDTNPNSRYKSNEIDPTVYDHRLSAEAEKKAIQEALRNAENERNQKTSKIDTCRIVGSTCAACSFSVMAGRIFPIVLLDECSQQTEPTSLIPMSFGCHFLVCCGDPQQLPPTLNKDSPNGFGRPLFTRLMKMYQPLMLSIQYRCHPRIADICSYAFYNGNVKNGIVENDREPLYNMPTIALFNVRCGEESFKAGSISNTSEAITVINLVHYLLNIGVPPEDIGVIAFYKAQVEEIAVPLSDGKRRPIVDVSTVDAFQGDERNIIIITTAKTKQSSFVDSPNRINVALSRAKRHLFIVANVSLLTRLDKWSYVVGKAGNLPNMAMNLDTPPDSNWNPFIRYQKS